MTVERVEMSAGPLFRKTDTMKYNKDKTKKIIKAITGLSILPIVFALFTFDRLILVFLPHVKHETFARVLSDLNLFKPILYRTITTTLLYGVYLLFKLIF